MFCWTKADTYWDVYYDLIEHLRETFAQAGVEMTYDHLNVHIVEKI
jgi:small conductance mechanosensitive channel